jgi:conjugative transfer signal peptidase TraF
MNVRKKIKIAAVFIMSSVLFVLFGLEVKKAGFRVNLTGSAPRGVYQPSGEQVRKGAMVAFCLEASNPYSALAAERGYLGRGGCPLGLYELLKTVEGVHGDMVKIEEKGITVGLRELANSKRPARDSAGREMPPSSLSDGIIPMGKLLVMSEVPNGFDSRHFGLIDAGSVRTVKLVFPF